MTGLEEHAEGCAWAVDKKMIVPTIDCSGARGHVYTLRLEGDYYYVGWSSSVEARIAQHFLGKGSEWTQLHKPVQVLTCLPGDTLLEDATTIALMCQHGWQQVRGGRWSQPFLRLPPDAIRYGEKYGSLKRVWEEGPADEGSQAATLMPDPPPPQILAKETSKIQQRGEDGAMYAWRAEITNAKAKQECPKRGFKCLYACTRQELIANIDAWRDEE